ncbi:MAG: SpoIIE family protein phosphatase [Desulfobacteraceae bacterium]|nr:SpoIIE family protein phosphatase [Desulfobacteraceae bacterium]
MKIHIKFFLVLMGFSLAPLLVVTVFNNSRIVAVGRMVSADIQENLTRTGAESLLLTARNYAKIILRTKNALETSLIALGSEAERLLQLPPPDLSRVYYADEFDTPGTAPEDFKSNPLYLQLSENQGMAPARVSFDHPVFLLAPGAEKEKVISDIARLTQLNQPLNELMKMMGDVIQWSYISLENGVHMSYPGHGGYPRNYDGRNRPWYRSALDHPTWTLPIVDATTRLVTFTASQKLRASDGSFLGVAGIDILITNVLQESEIAALWSSKMRSFLIEQHLNPDTDMPALKILAQKGYQKKVTGWEADIEMDWLMSPDVERFKKMAGNLHAGISGFDHMPYDDIDAIWAYAAVDDRLSFVVVVPTSVFMQLPDQAGRRIVNLTRDQLWIISLTALGAMCILAAAAYFGAKAITRSLLEISSAADSVAKGDFNVRINMKTGDERDKVIAAFNDMVPRLQDHLRIQNSMQLAHEVQQNLLPRTTPNVKGLDIAGKSIYCDETGGDYYDFLVNGGAGGRTIQIVVGDVSDHGIPSALLMATARSLLRQRSAMGGDIARIVTDVNREFAVDVKESCQFMTLYYMSIDMKNRCVKWVRAGHDPAVLYDPATDAIETLDGRGMALGVDKDWIYDQNERSGLTPGQIIVTGTDGLWEALNNTGEMFSKTKMYHLIREHAGQGARHIMDSILDELDRFKDGERPEDDVTLVVVKVSE